jgi:RepB DNA-primase from phage plasmid
MPDDTVDASEKHASSVSKLNQRERADQAAIFLNELGKGLPTDERVMVGYCDEATTATGTDGRKLNAGWWPVPYLPGKYVNPNPNCYVCISSSIKTAHPRRPGETRYWRGEASFGHGLCLMVDDIGHGAGSKGNLSVSDLSDILPPTAVVETSPGNHQLFYFLREPESDMRRFKAFLYCFVTQVLKDTGGDSTIKDVSRYGRMPCGVNNKRHSLDGPFRYEVEDKRGQRVPWPVHLVHADYSVRYTIDEIAEAFDFRIVVLPPRQAEFDPEYSEADFVWLRLAVKLLNDAGAGERSGGRVEENGSGTYRIRCPWGDEHGTSDPYGAYFWGPGNGKNVGFVFGCGHQTCRDANRKWDEFVDEVVMPSIYEELEQASKDFGG